MEMNMPILDMRTLEFVSRSPEQTRRLGIRLGSLLMGGDVLCLSGDLGSGKTTLVQGIAQGWGSLDSVSSPTFVIVNDYHRPAGDHLYHMDAYRLENARQAEDLDIIYMQENGAMVVEWPERIRAALPEEYLWVDLRFLADEQRGMVMHAQGSHYEQLLAEFRKRAFGG
jgi:tRNA threonylcarbamoyladenosine biosynthesis protein TsaE